MISRTLGSSRKFAALLKTAGKLGEFCQALYPLLVASADDFGRQAGDAFTVKHAVFPTSSRREGEFSAALDAMHRVGIICRYEVDGVQVIQIKDFDAHQPGLHKRTSSKFPGFSGNFPEIPSELNGTELKGTEQNRTALPRKQDEELTADGFNEFWSGYPKKKSRADAEKAWRTLAPSPELVQRIIAAVAAQRGSFDWMKDGGKFIPYPATWLRSRRWEDEEENERMIALVEKALEEPEDWSTECQREHRGICQSRYAHIEAMRHGLLPCQQRALAEQES